MQQTQNKKPLSPPVPPLNKLILPPKLPIFTRKPPANAHHVSPYTPPAMSPTTHSLASAPINSFTTSPVPFLPIRPPRALNMNFQKHDPLFILKNENVELKHLLSNALASKNRLLEDVESTLEEKERLSKVLKKTEANLSTLQVRLTTSKVAHQLEMKEKEDLHRLEIKELTKKLLAQGELHERYMLQQETNRRDMIDKHTLELESLSRNLQSKQPKVCKKRKTASRVSLPRNCKK